MMISIRDEVFRYVREKYDAAPEYLWARLPDAAVFRHSDNQKWFALVMPVRYDKLDPAKKDMGMADVLNVKVTDVLLRDLLIQQEGIYPGYHMNKNSWLTAVLDTTVSFDTITHLIDISHTATASAKSRQANRPPKEWIVPANPKYFDIVRGFDDTDELTWKQGKGIKAGDTVYIYAGAPVSAILYKCEVIETDIPENYHSEELTITKVMMLRLQKRYDPEKFTFERLKTEHGVYAVRGARGIPESLSAALKG